VISLPPRKDIVRFCLVVVGLSVCVIGAAGVTDSANTYALDSTGTSPYNFSELPADAQRIIENQTTTVEDIPEEFSSTRVTIVRYEGEKFCVRTENQESNQAPDGTRNTNQSVTVQDCTNFAFDFNDLSPRGQAVVSATLDGSDNRASLSQDVPQEFAVSSSEGGFTPPERDNPPAGGNYYIIKDGTIYQFTINGSFEIMNLYGAILLFIAGLIPTASGILSYSDMRIQTSVVTIAVVSVYVLPPLFSLLGLHRWSIWLIQQPQLYISGILLVLTSVGVFAYNRDTFNGESPPE
jgi:hypothetical protein